jgi:osmotically-inducible protein OsmY
VNAVARHHAFCVIRSRRRRASGPADKVDVTAADGWLTLKGRVKHQSDSDAAFAAVSGLPGVGGITNRIEVVTAG